MSKEKNYSIRDTIDKIDPNYDYAKEEDWYSLSRIIEDTLKKDGTFNLSSEGFNDHDINNIIKDGLYFVNRDDGESIKKVLYLQSAINKLYSRALEVLEVSSVEISRDIKQLMHAIVIKQCDDEDFYFNLSRLDLKYHDISTIIDPKVLPAVLNELINNNNKVQSFSFSFGGNNEISNADANYLCSVISSVCSKLTKKVDVNIDFYGCPKVHDILIKDEYKFFVTVDNVEAKEVGFSSNIDSYERCEEDDCSKVQCQESLRGVCEQFEN